MEHGSCSQNLNKSAVIRHFSSASWAIAQQYSRKLSIQQLPRQTSFWRHNSAFYKQFSTGPFLFFEFIHRLCYLFLILSIVAIIPIAANLRSKCSNVTTNTFIVAIMKTSIGCLNPTQSTSLTYVIIFGDCIYSIIILIYLCYENHCIRRTVWNYRMQNALASYYTIQVSNFHSSTTPQCIRQFFSKFGSVNQIVGIKAYQKRIQLCRQIHNVTMQIREYRMFWNHNKLKMFKLYQKRQKLYNQLDNQTQFSQGKAIKYLIKFDHIVDRQRTLRQFRKYQNGYGIFWKYPQQLKHQNKILTVESCNMQPQSIIWQNVHVIGCQRHIRSVSQILLIIISIFIGIVVICLLNIIGAFPDAILQGKYSYQYVKSKNDSTLTYSWCINHTTTQINNNNLIQFCKEYIDQYYKLLGIYIAVSFAIILTKQVMIRIIFVLGQLQRYHSYNEYHTWLFVGLFLVNVITTMIISIIVQVQINGVSIKKLMTIFAKDPMILLNMQKTIFYNDMNQAWYFDIGYKIIVNLVMSCLFPILQEPLSIFIDNIYTKYKASKQKVQYKLNKVLAPNNFCFEKQYSQILSLVFMCWILSGPLPIFNIICLFGVIIRSLYCRYYFIKYCKVPHKFNELLASKSIVILVWGLLIHILISIFSYGNKDLMPSPSWAIKYKSRFIFSWPLTIVFSATILIYVVKVFIIDTYRHIKQDSYKYSLPQIMIENNPQIVKSSGLQSYKLRENPRYKQVYIGLYTAAKKLTMKMQYQNHYFE